MFKSVLDNKFKVKHKKTGYISEVFNVSYVNTNYATIPYFLVYMNNRFQELPAEDFELCEEKETGNIGY